jgi:hypothetical protein
MNFASSHWINIGLVNLAKNLKEKTEKSASSSEKSSKAQIPDVLFLSDDDVEPIYRISPSDTELAFAVDEFNASAEFNEQIDSLEEIGTLAFEQSSGDLEELLRSPEKEKIQDAIGDQSNNQSVDQSQCFQTFSPPLSPPIEKAEFQHPVQPSSKCKVKINNWKYDYDINHKPYVLYRLQVSFGGQEWVSWKRFSHFKDLHNSVISRFFNCILMLRIVKQSVSFF